MKNLIHILIGAAALTLTPFLPGCDKADDNSAAQTPERIPDGGFETIRASHYILKYVEPKTISATAQLHDPIVSITYTYEWENRSSCGFREEAEPEKNPAQAAAYKALCERYDDLTYDKERYFHSLYQEQFRFLKHNIVSIDITSNASYDDAHAAGSSLKDLCLLQTLSPREYIASRYTKTFDWSPYPDYQPWARFEKPAATGDFPVSKPLADCKPEDLVLIGDGDTFLFNLRFTSPPKGRKHTFTVTITDEHGKTFTAATDQVQW